MLKERERALTRVGVAGFLGEAVLNLNGIPLGVRIGVLVLSAPLGFYGALGIITSSGEESESGHMEPSHSSTRTLMVSVVPTTPG